MRKPDCLYIKILASDMALLIRIARAEGESVAVVVRRLIRCAAAELGVRAAGLTSREDTDADHTR